MTCRLLRAMYRPAMLLDFVPMSFGMRLQDMVQAKRVASPEVLQDGYGDLYGGTRRPCLVRRPWRELEAFHAPLQLCVRPREHHGPRGGGQLLPQGDPEGC